MGLGTTFLALAADWQPAKLLIPPRNFINRFMPLQPLQITPSSVRKSMSPDFWNATSCQSGEMLSCVTFYLDERCTHSYTL